MLRRVNLTCDPCLTCDPRLTCDPCLTCHPCLTSHQAGHVCGDETDLIAGRPTGAVRVSFGYMSRRRDADRLLLMVRQCFVSAELRPEEAAERLSRARERQALNTAATTAAATATAAAAGVSNSPAVGGDRTQPGQENGSLAETAATRDLAGSSQAGHDQTSAVPSPSSPQPTVSTESVPPKDAPTKSTPSKSAPSRDSPSEDAPSEPASGARLSGLTIFPVKSCCGFSAPWWPLGPRGLLYDRHWMVVTAGGTALTQKRHPALCRVRPEISLHTGQLRLTADGETGGQGRRKRETGRGAEATPCAV